MMIQDRNREKINEKDKKIKSVAKANGLKSNFLIEPGRYCMTTFGRGAEAIRAKDIDVTNNTIEDYQDIFNVELNQKKKTTDLTLTGRQESYCNIPLKGQTNQLHAKETIEKIYFGDSFQDNIHIQIAYNIMDVQKILCAYISIAVCAINYMNRNIMDDFVGMFNTYNDYPFSMDIEKGYNKGLFRQKEGYKKSQYRSIDFDMSVWKKYQKKDFSSLNRIINQYINKNKKEENKYFKYMVLDFLESRDIRKFDELEKTAKNAEKYQSFSENLKASSYYFGEAFTDESGNFSEEKAFAMIRLIGMFRQSFFHGDKRNSQNNQIFNIEKTEWEDVSGLLDGILKQRIKNINEDFKKKNTVNLSILYDIYGNAKFEELVKEYYDFAIRKAHKNLGFSVKKIRELLLCKKELQETSEKKYDSVRSKMNNLIDFVIFYYFKENSEKLNRFVDQLRTALTEEEKQNCYNECAGQLWKELQSVLCNKIVRRMNAKTIQKISQNSKLPEVMNQEAPDIGKFAKAVYCLSLFLDAKEVNMLFSALIHKFAEIQSLFDVLDSDFLELKQDISEAFSIFRNSGKVVEDLRFLQSIARMNKGKKYKKDSKELVKFIQYKDAAALFGVTDEVKIKNLFGLNKNNDKQDHSLRNFMINNVINNNRFMYVVRFLSPGSARKIMENEKIVQYILKKLPQSQIERYCVTAEISFDEGNMGKSIEELAGLLAKISMEKFKNVKQDVKKEKYKSIVSLYLTVLYIVIKTLVRINTSYVIAISILERDFAIYERLENKKLKLYDEPLRLTAYFYENQWLNKTVGNCFEKNKKKFNVRIFREYRNQIMHLNVILKFSNYVGEIEKVKSLFDLYHFVLLEEICNKKRKGKLTDVAESTRQAFKQHEKDNNQYKKYNTMCKDFVYCINLPFAYNSARYLNLSVRFLFLKSFAEM